MFDDMKCDEIRCLQHSEREVRLLSVGTDLKSSHVH